MKKKTEAEHKSMKIEDFFKPKQQKQQHKRWEEEEEAEQDDDDKKKKKKQTNRRITNKVTNDEKKQQEEEEAEENKKERLTKKHSRAADESDADEEGAESRSSDVEESVPESKNKDQSDDGYLMSAKKKRRESSPPSPIRDEEKEGQVSAPFKIVSDDTTTASTKKKMAIEPKPAASTSAEEKTNDKIIKILKELEKIERNKGKIHQAKAYRKAIDSIAKYPKQITSGAEAEKLPGIGKKIGLKIDEILASGKLNKLERELSDETTVAINELSRVSGIGPVFARKLVEEHGIKSLDELRERSDKTKIKSGKPLIALNHHQQIGLKYVDEFEERIPREEIEMLEQIIKDNVHKHVDKDLNITICGSYRRGLPSSGDIDVLVTHPSTNSAKRQQKQSYLARIVSQLQKVGFLTDTLSMGETKYMGVCKLPDSVKEFQPHKHRRIDIRFVASDQYPTALLYYTGSDYFNNQMRAHALQQGYTINEYAITKKSDNKPVPVKTEKDIFDIIGMEYVEPKDRSM